MPTPLAPSTSFWYWSPTCMASAAVTCASSSAFRKIGGCGLSAPASPEVTVKSRYSAIPSSRHIEPTSVCRLVSKPNFKSCFFNVFSVVMTSSKSTNFMLSFSCSILFSNLRTTSSEALMFTSFRIVRWNRI